MTYIANEQRYDHMPYRRVGRSGLKLPAISLGLWHHFGETNSHQSKVEVLTRAFDLGVTHFDLANNYGPPFGAAEEAFGTVLNNEFKNYRDEIIVSSKAGYLMWPGPYGEWGSRKYLLSSCDQSLKRTDLEYFDIFYSHRFDPDTPLEETMGALDYIVRSGRALYAGISSYNALQTLEAAAILKDLGTPCIIHQPSYSMVNRWIEDDGLTNTLTDQGIGGIAFSPLAQGLLTNKYLNDIPANSRAKTSEFFNTNLINQETRAILSKLNDLASARGQSLAQMALAWVLRDPCISSALVGVSSVEQLENCVAATNNLEFGFDELMQIDRLIDQQQFDIWTGTSD